MRPLPLVPTLQAWAAATKWVGWVRPHGEAWRAAVEANSQDAAWDQLLTLPAPATGHFEQTVLPEGIVPRPPRKRKARPT